MLIVLPESLLPEPDSIVRSPASPRNDNSGFSDRGPRDCPDPSHQAETNGKRLRTVPTYGDMERWLRFQFEKRVPDFPWGVHHHGHPA